MTTAPLASMMPRSTHRVASSVVKVTTIWRLTESLSSLGICLLIESGVASLAFESVKMM